VIKDETVTEPETFDLVLPDEPPVGSVVVDSYGRAWQRLTRALSGSRWCVAGSLIPAFDGMLPGAPELSWGRLLLQRGELTLVYTPEKKIDRGDT